MRFKLLNSGDNWSFELNSDAGSTILKGGNFPSRDAVVQAIRSTIASMREENNYAQDANGTYRISSDGNLLASSTADAPSAADLRQQALATTDFPVDFTTTTTTTTRRRLNTELPTPPSLEEMAVLYVITRSSSSGQAGPELFEEDGKYRWHFNDAGGNAIMYGRGFESGSKRKANIRTALRYGKKIKYYQLLEEGGQYYFVLRTPNGFEIARSGMFASADARQAAIDYFMANAETYKADYAKATRKQKLNRQEYVFDYASTSGAVGFETFKNEENKKHYFHLNDADGKALLFSQGYRGGKPRDTGMRSVIKNGNNRARYRIKERDGKFYVVLLAANNQEIARSRPLESEAQGEEIITYLLSVMPGYAQQYGVELVTTTATETDTFSIAMDVPAPEPAEPQKPKEAKDNYMPCSAYDTEPGPVGFHKFKHDKNEHYFFSYNDENGATVWRSEGYTTTAARDNGIESVKKNAVIEGRITTHTTKSGKYYAVIKAGNHQEIARSCYLAEEKDLALRLAPFMQDHGMDANAVLGGMFAGWEGWRSEWGWWQRKEEQERLAAQAEEERPAAEAEAKAKEEAAKKRNQEQDNYMPCAAYAGSAGFYKFTHEGNKHHFFAYNDEDGKTILRSEGYTTEAARDNGIESVKKNAGIEARYKTHTSKSGKYYFTLHAGNHQEIARSCPYDDEKGMALAMAPVMQDYGLDANTLLGGMFAGWAAWRSDWGWWTKKEEEEQIAMAAAKVEEEKAAAEKAALAERKRKLDVDNYLPCKQYKVGKGYREFKQNNQYYFTFNDNRGEVVLRSEGYNQVAARNKGRDWVKRQMKDRKNFVEKHTAAGKYYFVLMANENTEIARSCYYDDKAAMLAALGGLFPKKETAAAAGIGAAAAGAAGVVAAKGGGKKETKAAAATPPPTVTKTESSGGWWKWLLPLLLLLLLFLLWRGCDGCNGCNNKATPPPVEKPDTSAADAAAKAKADSIAAAEAAAAAKAEAEAKARAEAAAAARAGNPIFDLSRCNNPKELTRLGTNPEFGSLKGLSETDFYNKLKRAYDRNARDKKFLDDMAKGMGYAGGFADITPDMISSVRMTPGTIGNMGRGRNHSTSCCQLNTSGDDLDAFRIRAAVPGYDMHFMKTCGNHFFIRG